MQKNDQLTLEIKAFANSPEIYSMCEKIGSLFNLHIDQISEIDYEIRKILLGINKSTDFTKHIKDNLEIDDDLANKITAEANKVVFQTIEARLRSQTANQQNLSTLERAGGFSIEKEDDSDSADFSGVGVTSKDKDRILSGIEDPAPKEEVQQSYSKIASKEIHIEPLSDHLLNSMTARPEEIIKYKVNSAPTISTKPIAPTNLPIGNIGEGNSVDQSKPKTPPSPPKPIGPDSYREPITP